MFEIFNESKELIGETIHFIIIVPFTEHKLFPILMYTIAIISLLFSIYMHMKSLKEYRNNIDNFIFDDREEAISSASTPGVLMSIGIIGTFYLIYTSLSNLDGKIEIENMLSVITNSIAPAFSISALGIALSILYIFLEKLFVEFPYERKMKQIKRDSSNIRTYENIATSQLATTQKILVATQEQVNSFEALNDFSKGLGEMSESMAKFGEIANRLDETLNPKVLGEVISSALMKEMSPVLNNIQAITSNVDSNSRKITKFLEVDLKDEIIVPLKDSVDNTSESMKNIEQALNKTSNAMIETNKGFDKLTISLNQLESLQENFVIKLDGVLDKQKKEFEQTTKTITSTYDLLTNTVTEQTKVFEENSQTILTSFTGLSMDMKDFLEGYKKDYKIILEEQQKAIVETKDSAVKILDKSGEKASSLISEASNTLDITLSNVNTTLLNTSETAGKLLNESGEKASELISNASNTLDKTLSEVNTTLVNTSEKAGEILEKSGQGVANVIDIASNNLDSTLKGIDAALIKTSESITEKLTEFKDSYTETLKGFLDKQADELHRVFGEHTEKLKEVVLGFKDTLEDDVSNRKILNEDLEKLVKTTNGFVSSTQAMITTAFDEQQSQLVSFMDNNKSMQSKLTHLIDNATDINDSGNILTKELIDTTANLSKQFNDNQIEVLEKYQGKVDEHLRDILNYMAAIIEATHLDANK